MDHHKEASTHNEDVEKAVETLNGDTPLSQTRELDSSSLKEKVVDADVEGVADELDWDNDPDNARNWRSGKKWMAVSVVSLYCFITPLSSSMMAPGLPQVAEIYGIRSSVVLGMTLSIFLLSFAIGPLFFSPLSEIYGRTWILHVCNILTGALNLGCAFAPNTATLVVLRLLSGFPASAPVAIGAGTIGDLFNEKERASAMALFSMGPLVSPAIGPTAAGFIVQGIGLKWVFIIIAIASGLATIVGIPLLQETYAPVIRMRKARKSANPDQAVARVVRDNGEPERSMGEIIWINLSRPMALLFGNFICFILSLYMSINYGIYYLMFATFARLFHDVYDFKPGVAGLAYLGIGLGFMSATILGAQFSNKLYEVLSKRNGGKGTPEMRMPALFVASVIIPIGLLWYGWSAHTKIHWIMPIIGTFIFGFGLMTAFLPISLYLVDAFKYAASASAAAAVLRSLFGFVFPLFAQDMSDKMGIGPANTLLAGAAIIVGLPFSLWIYYRGAAVRERGNFARLCGRIHCGEIMRAWCV